MQSPLLGGRYRRDHVIGRGAMGEVWLAHDELLDRTVAVKTISSNIALTSLATPVRDDQLQRIMREARLAARINHPNAVAVYDLVMTDGQPNVVMEYVPGRTFADEIRASGALDPIRVAEVGAAVAAALAEAHELGIIHRDVKPANILITRRGTPKLADFGVAKINGDAGVTTTGIMLGTPAFVSPEVARGAAADAASDIWSLGATLYAALRGRSPFQETGAEDAIVVLGRLISQPVPALGRGPVPDLVMRMLDASPARRPSAEQVAALLGSAAGQQDDADRTYVPPPVPVQAFAVPGAESSAARWSQPTELRDLMAGSGPGSGSGPVAGPRRTGRTAALVATAVVPVAVVALAAVLLATHGGSKAATGAPGSTSRARTAPAARVVTVTAAGQPPVTVAAGSPPSTSAPQTDATDGGQDPTGTAAYAAPGGITVDGPAGWSENDFFQVPRTKEYVDGADYYTEPYLHLGVGNDHPLADWNAEVEGSRTFLLHNKKYHDAHVNPAVYVDYRGTTAADIEFTEINAYDVARHGKERLWEENGVVYVIQLNTPADVWDQYAADFDDLTDSCSIG